LCQDKFAGNFFKNKLTSKFLFSFRSEKSSWDKDFRLVNIQSSLDSSIQKAYFYPTTSKIGKPLIVSLHTWSGDYSQYDELAQLCKSKDINYIHPDFRASNSTKDACCSKLALQDIDESISYTIENANVDTSKIYVIGLSGGGYAALSTFMKSKHKIRKFSAWASMTDLVAWYNECRIRESDYADDILNCTASKNGVLNIKNAQRKSPINWQTPKDKFPTTSISIYAGVYDGVQGSVPFNHSINFYNKVLTDLLVSDSSKYVSDSEKIRLYEYIPSMDDVEKISNRRVLLKKEYGNLKLVIFEGNHEMLTNYAFNELLEGH